MLVNIHSVLNYRTLGLTENIERLSPILENQDFFYRLNGEFRATLNKITLDRVKRHKIFLLDLITSCNGMILQNQTNQNNKKSRAPRNRTLELSPNERKFYKKNLLKIENKIKNEKQLTNKTIHGDLFQTIGYIPEKIADLIFIDPPYNLSKNYNSNSFYRKSDEAYIEWLESWLPAMERILKDDGSMYVCCDWKTSPLIYLVGKKYFTPQNRITWEREKGRGSKNNWKNCSEDIWFFTKSCDYSFHLERVKVQRKVIAPYVDKKGAPKDWIKSDNGNFRITHPSNLWNDLTIPFWSMPENTDHSTQKPEKLVAKIILASSNEGDLIFDPFLGSGTTSVVAKKLKRNFLGIEMDEEYCCLAEKRLAIAEENTSIQGFYDGIFWERNSFPGKGSETK